jgi:hypothetical protein
MTSEKKDNDTVVDIMLIMMRIGSEQNLEQYHDGTTNIGFYPLLWDCV